MQGVPRTLTSAQTVDSLICVQILVVILIYILVKLFSERHLIKYLKKTDAFLTPDASIWLLPGYVL